MTQEEIIHKLQYIKPEDEVLIRPGVTGIDISKPIAIEELILIKRNRSIGHAPPEEMPFELIHHLDLMDVYGYKKTYTLLGLLFFELLFSEQSFIKIDVTNPKTELKTWYVYVERVVPSIFEFALDVKQREQYKGFEYMPQEVDKFALSQFPEGSRMVVGNSQLASFVLGCEDYAQNFVSSSSERFDQVIMQTSVEGLIQMAELLIDMGSATNDTHEVCLENPIFGFGGVAETSIDVRFWLPQSFGFDADTLEELEF